MSFFFNDTATTEIYTLSLHDALPIFTRETYGAATGIQSGLVPIHDKRYEDFIGDIPQKTREDRKSTRLNSSHSQISYAVFCLKKKQNYIAPTTIALPNTCTPHIHACL